nr:MAG TPA: hypothetical protein [Caudoviricetes sp.]
MPYPTTNTKSEGYIYSTNHNHNRYLKTIKLYTKIPKKHKRNYG